MNDRTFTSTSPSAAVPPDLDRRTSFARSFFDAGAGLEALQWSGSDEDEEKVLRNRSSGARKARGTTGPAAVLEESTLNGTSDDEDGIPPCTEKPRRKVSYVKFRKRQGSATKSLAPVNGSSRLHGDVAALIEDSGDDSSGNEYLSTTAKMPPYSPAPVAVKKPSTGLSPSPRRGLQRQPSWLLDAMKQGGEGMDQESIRLLLGLEDMDGLEEVAAVETSATAGKEDAATEQFDDDEVLEQYRIMAHFQAHAQFKQKVGCEVEEYQEKRLRKSRQLSNRDVSGTGEQKKEDERSHLLPSQVPPLQLPLWNSNNEMFLSSSPSQRWKVLMPLLPPLSELQGAMEGQRNRPDEFQTARISARAPVVTRGDVATIRCYRCKSHLQLDPMASLVACPSCSVVNPNNATRL